MNLSLKLKHAPENLSLRYSVNEYAWGKLEFVAEDGLEPQVLFSLEWNLIYFVEWYLEYHLPLFARPFWIDDIKADESMAQAVMRPIFYQQRLSNQWVNGFLAPINLRRAFRYFAPIPQILIGRRSLVNGNPDEGEISLAGFNTIHRHNHFKIAIAYPKTAWAYRFALSQYRHDSRLEMLQFLEHWGKIAPTHVKPQAQNLLKQLMETRDRE